MSTKITTVTLLALTSVGLASRVAHAQAQIVPADGIKGAEKTDVGEWNPFLNLTSTVSLIQNSSVVGQVDGFSMLFGLGVTGGADYVKGKHLLRSSLSLNEGFARTPVVDELIKTNDVVKLEGLYNYFLTKDYGLFGRLAFSTSAFKAEDVRGVATSWVEKNTADPTMNIPLNQNAFRQKLAGSFNPFSINESAGVFVDPLRKEKLSVSVRAGIGGRHTFAGNVLLIDDDKATPEVELLRLSDVHQLGAEAFAGASGKTKDGRANYKAGLSILLPVVNNDKYDRSIGALARIGFEGQLTFNMYSWMGLVYSLNITRDAQLFPEGNEAIQIQNTLLLTFQFSIVKKREAPKEKTPEQIELEAAQKRADEAEKRAKEAEEKLKGASPPPAPDTQVPAPGAPAPTPTTTPP
ncbi:MAG TPA: hypothetical protein VIV40_29680 [Kofleriaceae bacterium]